MPTLVRKRDPSFDVVKAFLMYFVIRGHLTAAGIVSPPDSPPPTWIGAMVVGASMPCFFAISGFFAAKAFETRNWPKIAAKIMGVLWPIASFGILLFIRGHDITIVPQTVVNLFNNLWFLRTLVFIYLISAVVFLLPVSWHGRTFFIIYLMLIFLHQFIPGSMYWKNVMHMIPYFAFGLFFLGRCLEQSAIWLAIAASIFFLSISLLEGSVQTNGMGFYWVNHSWKAMLLTKRGLLCFFGRTFMGVTGTIFLLWTFRCLLNNFRWLSCLAPFGTTTLGVYAMHQWILAQVGAHFHPPFPLLNVWNWGITGIVFLVCHIAVLFIQRNRFVKCFFFGDESRLRKILELIFAFHNPNKSTSQ